MKTIPVQNDEKGLYVRTGGYIFRPGATRSYSHALRMDDAGLMAGDRVKARHKGGTPLAKLTLMDGTTTYWAEEETSFKDRVVVPSGVSWKKDGSCDFNHPQCKSSLSAHREVKTINGKDVADILRQES